MTFHAFRVVEISHCFEEFVPCLVVFVLNCFVSLRISATAGSQYFGEFLLDLGGEVR